MVRYIQWMIQNKKAIQGYIQFQVCTLKWKRYKVLKHENRNDKTFMQCILA